MLITASYLSSFIKCKKLFLLISSCRSHLFSSKPWHSSAGGRFNQPVSCYNTVLGYKSIFSKSFEKMVCTWVKSHLKLQMYTVLLPIVGSLSKLIKPHLLFCDVLVAVIAVVCLPWAFYWKRNGKLIISLQKKILENKVPKKWPPPKVGLKFHGCQKVYCQEGAT